MPGEKPKFNTQLDGVKLPLAAIRHHDQILVDRQNRIWVADQQGILRYTYTDDNHLRVDSFSLYIFLFGLQIRLFE